MKRLSRRVKRHFHKPTKPVAIKSRRAWYWQWLMMIGLVVIGYLLAYWRLSTTGTLSMASANEPTRQEFMSRTVFAERQLQVQRAAQDKLAHDFEQVQDELIKLKEDLAFYKSMQNGDDVAKTVKLTRLFVEKSKVPGHYQYHLVLSQQGNSTKPVQGSLSFIVQGRNQQGQVIKQALLLQPANSNQAKVNFRYYQRMDGSFSVPDNLTAEEIELSFVETGAAKPNISQKVELPG